MMEENELSDIFRIRYPDSRQFTWRCKNPLKQRRLDYLLISDSLQHEVEIFSHSNSIEFYGTNRINHVPHLYDIEMTP